MDRWTSHPSSMCSSMVSCSFAARPRACLTKQNLAFLDKNNLADPNLNYCHLLLLLLLWAYAHVQWSVAAVGLLSAAQLITNTTGTATGSFMIKKVNLINNPIRDPSYASCMFICTNDMLILSPYHSPTWKEGEGGGGRGGRCYVIVVLRSWMNKVGWNLHVSAPYRAEIRPSWGGRSQSIAHGHKIILLENLHCSVQRKEQKNQFSFMARPKMWGDEKWRRRWLLYDDDDHRAGFEGERGCCRRREFARGREWMLVVKLYCKEIEISRNIEGTTTTCREEEEDGKCKKSTQLPRVVPI